MKSVLAMLALLLTGCTAQTAGTGTPVTRSAPVHRLEQAWAPRGIHPVSPVDVVDGIPIVYGSVGSQLRIFGLDPATGGIVWQADASTAAQPGGIEVQVASAFGKVVYFAPSPAQYSSVAEVVIADPRTGRTLARTPPLQWVSTPTPCGSVLCASAYSVDGYTRGARLIDPGTGAVTDDPASARAHRDLGAGLDDPLVRTPEVLEYRVAGTLSWSRALAQLFGPGVSTDNGWSFQTFGPVIVGTVGRPPPGDPRAATVTVDLGAGFVTAGFRAVDGLLLWRHQSEALDCQDTLDNPQPATPLVCRYAGSITDRVVGSGTAMHPQVRDLGVVATLERLDPTTGRAQWQQPLPGALAITGYTDDAVPVVTDDTVVVRAAGVATVLDLVTGARRSASAGDVAWCRSEVYFVQSPRPAPNEAGPNLRRGHVAYSCGPDSAPSAALPALVPAPVGATLGTLHIVATPAAVLAFRQT